MGRKRKKADPDWGTDPDLADDFPDDPAIARDLARYRRRGLAPGILSLILLAVTAYFVVPPLLARQDGRSEWLTLVRAGGGEVRYAASGIKCQVMPQMARRGGKIVGFGTRLEIVARENGWALTDRFGDPCWMPEWALRDTPVNWRGEGACGMKCWAKAPPGWDAEQGKAACSSSPLDQLGCAAGK